jgi:hypothetical protein
MDACVRSQGWLIFPLEASELSNLGGVFKSEQERMLLSRPDDLRVRALEFTV